MNAETPVVQPSQGAEEADELQPLQGISTDAPEETKVEGKIEFLLLHYPILSPTMLQGALGPQFPPRVWKPVFAEMIRAGKLVQGQKMVSSHLGDFRSIATIELTKDYRKALEDFVKAHNHPGAPYLPEMATVTSTETVPAK